MTAAPSNDRVPVPRNPGSHPAVQNRRSPQAGMSAQDFFQVLNRRKWAVILTVVLFAIFTVGGTFLWWLYLPIYSAAAEVRVSDPTKSPLGSNFSGVDKATIDRTILTYAQMFKSDTILTKAIADPEVKATYWHQQALEKDPDRIAEQLYKDLSVAPITNTSLIKVSMTNILPDKTRASELALIVNKICGLVADAAKAADRLDLERQIYALEKEKKEKESKRPSISQIDDLENQAPGLRERQRQFSDKINDLNKYEMQLRATKAQAAAAWTQMKDKKDEDLANSITVQSVIESDPAIQQLKIKLWAMNLELDRLKRKYGDSSRNVQDMDEQVKSLEQEIAKKVRIVTDLTVAQIRESARMVSESYDAEIVKIQLELENCRNELVDIAAALGKLDVLKGKLKDSAGSLEEIDRRLVELNLLLGKVPTDPSSPDFASLSEEEKKKRQPPLWTKPLVIEHEAVTPKDPLWPKWKVTIPVGILLGVVCGIAVALLLETSDKIVRTPADIAKRVSVPLLGVIPHAGDVNERIGDIRKAFMTNPESLICESFRRLTTSILFGRDPGEHSSLLVTSAMAEDGRSTVAMNLAACLAQAGKNVIIVDANFRHPIGRKLFPDCPEQGLTNVLSGEASWEELVFEIAPNLTMLSAGPMPTDPMEFFSAGQFKTLVDDLTSRYEHVVFDGGPCMIVADAQALSAMVSGVLLVIRGGTTAYGLVQRMRETVKGLGGNVMGIVLNAARFTPGGYFRENYRAYYDYRERGRHG